MHHRARRPFRLSVSRLLSLLAPLERNDFQEFVLQSTGQDLPLFGSDLFRNVPTTFAPLDNVPVTPDYVLGPGDEILIRAWGNVDIDYRTAIDRNGSISLPRVGVINVAGIKYADLSRFLHTQVGRVFKNFELTATLGQLRSIQVLVVGQVQRPGNFTVSSLATMVNAVFAAGGPTSRGSMRGIQLRRADKLITELDLYDLVLAGDKSRDVQLLPGDVIFVPPIGAQVAVAGAVNTPAVFEIKKGASVSEALQWAGGLATTAQARRATLERIEERRARRVEELALDSAGLARPLRDGDLLTVFSLVPRFENAVTLRGNVAQPARFPWRDGLRVSDVIPERDSLLTRDYWLRRNAAVLGQSSAQRSPIPISARETELVELQQNSDPRAAASARMAREQRRALTPHPQPITSIRSPLGEINWNYAVIERLNPADLSTTLLPFNLQRAVVDADPTHNISLQPGDIITIFSKDDIRVAQSQQTRFVRLEGEFVQSGVFQVQPGETLRQLVERTGGVTANAYLFGAEFTRESTRVAQQRQLEEAISRLEQEAQNVVLNRARAATTQDEAAASRQQAEAQQALIGRLKAMRATGRVVLEIQPQAVAISELPDLPLENGDTLVVPSRPGTVNVVGSVYNPNAFLHRSGRRLGDYLGQAGGPTRDGDGGSVYLVRADGSVVSKRQRGWLGNFDSIEMNPGDAIVVPQEFDRFSLSRELKDWTQILYQFAFGVVGLKVLKDL